MIQRLEIAGLHTEVTPELRKYVTKKIGRLDMYVPRHARASIHAEVKLKESKRKNKQSCTCEVILHLPQETFVVHESTMNMFAAVDIVETKLKNQLKRYKEKHESRRSRLVVRRALGKINRIRPSR